MYELTCRVTPLPPRKHNRDARAGCGAGGRGAGGAARGEGARGGAKRRVGGRAGVGARVGALGRARVGAREASRPSTVCHWRGHNTHMGRPRVSHCDAAGGAGGGRLETGVCGASQ